MKKKMMLKQIIRLIRWLRNHGFNDTDILDCIEYISTDEPKQKGKKEKPVTPPTTDK